MSESWFNKAIIAGAMTAASIVGGPKEAEGQSKDKAANKIENVKQNEPLTLKSLSSNWDDKTSTFEASVKLDMKQQTIGTDTIVCFFVVYNEKGEKLANETELFNCEGKGEKNYSMVKKYDLGSHKDDPKYRPSKVYFQFSLVKEGKMTFTSEETLYDIGDNSPAN